MVIKYKQNTVFSLAVTKITSHLPECDGPFPGVAYATIGTLFHNICSSLLSGLSSHADLWAKQKRELRPIDQATAPALRDKAIQPMRNFIYDHILKQQAFKKFHELISAVGPELLASGPKATRLDPICPAYVPAYVKLGRNRPAATTALTVNASNIVFEFIIFPLAHESYSCFRYKNR
jgi:hypothetical protein